MEHPNMIALQRYLCMLSDMQDYEAVLSIQKMESIVGDLIYPPSEQNLSIWRHFIHAAAETGEIDFVGRHMPVILNVCGEADEFDFLMCLLNVYQGEELAAIKQRLRVLLPKVPFNKYFEESIRKQIENETR